MAAKRSESMWEAFRTIWSRGGVLGFYQGLIPWVRAISDSGPAHHDIMQGWIEASTKGAVLLFTASAVETALTHWGFNATFAGFLAGMAGGIAQAYGTMGMSEIIC